jgi:hypothetical protein
MNDDTMDSESDDSDLDRELDVGIPLKSATYLSCRNAMRDNGRLQLLVDQQDEKIKKLEFKVNMTSPAEVMLINIINAKSKPPYYPVAPSAHHIKVHYKNEMSTCMLRCPNVCDTRQTRM